MHEDYQAVRRILEFSDTQALPQFYKAPTNVLQYFVERADDNEFKSKNHLKSQVKAMLEARKNLQADESAALSKDSFNLSSKSLKVSEDSLHWSRKSYEINKVVLLVTIAALVIGMVQLILQVIQIVKR